VLASQRNKVEEERLQDPVRMIFSIAPTPDPHETLSDDRAAQSILGT
jgi:hypothetical protein